MDQHDTWTCRRCFDGALVQIDFIIGDSRAIFEKGWCDNDFPIGNDHRAVHCILGFRLSKVLACKRVNSLKSWRPNLDENGEATEYKTLLVASIPTLQPFTFNAAESSWRRTMFTMLGKHAKAKLVSDFRPIASVRVLYKTFAYMILGRIEQCLEDSQPEEQHGFRGGRRLEEHLVTANLISDKLFAANRPLWIVSLDLSKVFDRINWDALWQWLLEHGVSAHLVWILQLLYCEQTGEVKGTWGNSTIFPIKAGVRQGCVLSPRPFCSVLQWAMQDWRAWAEGNGWGIDFHDGYPPLLDLRFADDILIFGDSAEGAASLLDALITTLDRTGLKLNASKTVILTTEAQPPDHITTPAGHTIVVKDSFGTHKWLGCMLSAIGSGNADADITYHLQAAARAFHSNKWMFLHRNVSIKSKLKLFEATVTPIACFAAGHRSIRQRDLHTLDVEFRRLVRSVVGPPSGVCWSSPWHEILHVWNARVQQILESIHQKSWGQTALCHHWKLVGYIANLPPNRWAKRALEWQPRAKRVGRRTNTQPCFVGAINA